MRLTPSQESQAHVVSTGLRMLQNSLTASPVELAQRCFQSVGWRARELGFIRFSRMHLSSSLYKARTLSATELLLLVRVTLLLFALRVLLQVLPFRFVMHQLDRLHRNPNAGEKNDEYRRRVVWAVGVAGRRVLGARPCLPEALGGRLLLRRRGFDVRLQIGVAKTGTGRLQAHAWLEEDGKIILGGQESILYFTPLPTLEKALF